MCIRDRHSFDGDWALAGPWNQEASQPPLYYYLGAALTFWIDQSDMAQARWLNPHVDNGLIPPDGRLTDDFLTLTQVRVDAR